MTDPTWMAGLRQQVADANARTLSTFAKVEDGRRRVAAQLDHEMTRLGRVADARAQATGGDLHGRVVEAFRRGTFGALSVREQRYASKQFELVSAAGMQPLLTAHPSNWRTFVAECFRRFESFAHHADRAGYTRLLCLAPSSISYLHLTGRPQDIVADPGPTIVAQLIEGADLVEARLGLQQRGFDSTWSFTSVALAMWARLKVDRGHSFRAAWDAVMRDLVAETMLMPSLRGQNRSWFAQVPRPARVRGGVVAHAVFVSTMLRAAYATGADPGQWNAFAENLLQSEFGDPRIPPESEGWATLKRFDEPSYTKFLELLITEDLTVFFEYAMSDPRRKAFWLRYLKSVRRTVCVLNRVAHTRIKSQLGGADEKLAAAILRARLFAGPNSGAQAFCLYFDSVVVVEFSEPGNAAQIYERGYFEKHFERAIYAEQARGHTALKTPLSAGNRKGVGERIIHVGDWEPKADLKLRALGIACDRR